MSSVCPCPFCGQQTTVPEHLDPARIVRCPLCEYEFPLDDALFNATEAPPDHVADPPPELVPVDPPAPKTAPSDVPDADDTVRSPTTLEPNAGPLSEEPNAVPRAEIGSASDEEAATGIGPSRSVTLAAPPPDSIPESPPQDDESSTAGCVPANTPPLVVSAEVSATSEQAILVGHAVEISTGSEEANFQEVGASTVPLSEAAHLPEIVAAVLPTGIEAAPEGASGVVEEMAALTVTEPAPDVAEADAGGGAWSPSAVDTAEDAGLSAPAEVSGQTYVVASSETAIDRATGQVVGTVAQPEAGGQEAADETAGHEEPPEGPFGFRLHEPGEAGAAVGAWRERHQRNPIRSFIGVVISGALGLAVAYGLMSWLGPSRLQFWRASRRQAVEGNSSSPAGKPAEPSAKQSKTSQDPDDPKSFTEFPDLDDKRFDESPKRDVRSAKSQRAPKGPGGRKGP